jgi:hypothetical protein
VYVRIHGRCTPANIQVSGDGHTIRLRPLRPLRAGRNYQLVVQGLPDHESVHWRAGSASVSGPDLEKELNAAYDSIFAGQRTHFRNGDARALLVLPSM